MIEIKDLLANVKDLILSGEGKKQCVVESIQKVAHITVTTEQVDIKNGTVYLAIKPIYKNHIFLKKNEIMAEIESCLGKKSPKDMR